jgi:ferredoxin
MPTVTFDGERIECESGARLRRVLLDAGVSPHNGPTALSCHGLGTCGTCAVEIEGDVAEPTARERARLDFPPHSMERGLRLACQVRVTDDLTVTKHDGFWGQHTE